MFGPSSRLRKRRAAQGRACGGASADDSAKDPAVVNAYRDAAKLLRTRRRPSDAATFPDQLGSAAASGACTLLRRGHDGGGGRV
jgi:hypothetical protein